MPVLTPSPKQQFTDNAGNLAIGYKLYTYAAGTTNPLATYQDRAGASANTNPIILNARGEATIYLQEDKSYDFKFESPDGSLTWTQPGVETQDGRLRVDLQSTAAGQGAALVSYRIDAPGAVTRSVAEKMMETVSPDDFGAVGDGITNDTPAFQLASNYLMTHADNPAGGTIRCTPGKKYAFGSTWSVTKTAGRQFNVDMAGSEFTKTVGGWPGAILYYGNPTDVSGGYPLRIRNGRFQGVGADGTGVVLEWGGNSCFDGVLFLNFVQGLALTNSFAVSCVNKTQFLNCSTAGILCNTISHHLTVDGCGFYGNQRDIYFIVGAPAYNLNVVNSDFEGSAAAGSVFLALDAGGASVNVDGCYIEGKNGSPFSFGAAVEAFNFTNSWLGYNTGTQAWTNISSGWMDGNIFWDQQQTLAASVTDFDIGHNTFNGTSNRIYTPWQAPTFTNGFSNTGGPWVTAGFRKDRNGVVWLRGMVQAAADGSAFSLPVGYRPSAATAFIGLSSAGSTASLGRIQVTGGGSVSVFRTADTTCDLGMVSFTATQ